MKTLKNVQTSLIGFVHRVSSELRIWNSSLSVASPFSPTTTSPTMPTSQATFPFATAPIYQLPTKCWFSSATSTLHNHGNEVLSKKLCLCRTLASKICKSRTCVGKSSTYEVHQCSSVVINSFPEIEYRSEKSILAVREYKHF